ncbi:hypothetical protein H845_1523 [Komagataeibacter xylinus E25]|nr:hypothetical protein H845_1523 [Komagataeibacter xylinus E25]
MQAVKKFLVKIFSERFTGNLPLITGNVLT